MPKVMYDAKGHRCQRMYGREYVKGATIWNITPFFYCPRCNKAYDEREMQIEDVQHVRVLKGAPISIGVGVVDVPKGTIKDQEPDKNGFYTMKEEDLRRLIGEELDRRLKGLAKRKKGL